MNKSKLDELIEQEPMAEDHSIITRIRNPISQIYITSGALAKAYAYARIACDVAKTMTECYGLLITPKAAKDRIVRDIFFPSDQEVMYTDVKLGAEYVIKAGREIDALGYKVLGWQHSHADFGTFHSGTDDENSLIVLNEISPVNYITTYQKHTLLDGALNATKQGNRVELHKHDKGSSRIIFTGKNQEFTRHNGFSNIQRITMITPVRIGFAYSIVVDAIGSKPYADIATRTYCGLCYEGEDSHRKTRLRIIHDDSLQFSEKKMSREVKKKMREPFAYNPHSPSMSDDADLNGLPQGADDLNPNLQPDNDPTFTGGHLDDLRVRKKILEEYGEEPVPTHFKKTRHKNGNRRKQ
jgi:hypothetical protein